MKAEVKVKAEAGEMVDRLDSGSESKLRIVKVECKVSDCSFDLNRV